MDSKVENPNRMTPRYQSNNFDQSIIPCSIKASTEVYLNKAYSEFDLSRIDEKSNYNLPNNSQNNSNNSKVNFYFGNNTAHRRGESYDSVFLSHNTKAHKAVDRTLTPISKLVSLPSQTQIIRKSHVNGDTQVKDVNEKIKNDDETSTQVYRIEGVQIEEINL